MARNKFIPPKSERTLAGQETPLAVLLDARAEGARLEIRGGELFYSTIVNPFLAARIEANRDGLLELLIAL